ncbi:MAG: protein kinase [Planctomycetota bacterium]
MAENVSDEAFARAAQQGGVVSYDDVEAARSEQAESANQGRLVALADVLIQQGVITAKQRENLEKKILAQQAGGIMRLGQYKLIKKLGEGGMGAVYLAEDLNVGRNVAVKVLPKKHSEDREFLTRFRREAQATGKLNHVNIVGAYTVGEERGLHYYAMEYCDGEPLDRILKRELFIQWDLAVGVVLQVARGLKHAHENSIIHRDIKPGNIFICKPLGSGRRGDVGERDLFVEGFVAKILDLGLSKTLGAGSSFYTQTGVALGTPHYISPEQANGDKNIDGRTDIYSLGATFYHLVTGETPFQASTPMAIMMKHINEQLPNPQDIRDEIPDGVVQVIQRMMAKAPADRYADCKELLDDLELVIDGKMPSSQMIEVGKSSVAVARRVSRTPAGRPASGEGELGARASRPPTAAEGVAVASPPPVAAPVPPVGTRRHEAIGTRRHEAIGTRRHEPVGAKREEPAAAQREEPVERRAKARRERAGGRAARALAAAKDTQTVVIAGGAGAVLLVLGLIFFMGGGDKPEEKSETRNPKSEEESRTETRKTIEAAKQVAKPQPPTVVTKPQEPAAAETKAAAVDDPERWNNAIDLLALIEPQKDAVSGKWLRRNGTLVSDSSHCARIEIPYRACQEYDFRIAFTRTTGNDWVVQVLDADGHPFTWQFGGPNKLCGFERIKGRDLLPGDPAAMQMPISNGDRHVSTVQVRVDGVAAFLDGKLLARWQGGYSDLRAHPDWALRSDGLIGLGCNNSGVIFHSIEVLEVKGKGDFTRPDDPAAKMALAKREATGGQPAVQLGPLPATEEAQLNEFNAGLRTAAEMGTASKYAAALALLKNLKDKYSGTKCWDANSGEWAKTEREVQRQLEGYNNEVAGALLEVAKAGDLKTLYKIEALWKPRADPADAGAGSNQILAAIGKARERIIEQQRGKKTADIKEQLDTLEKQIKFKSRPLEQLARALEPLEAELAADPVLAESMVERVAGLRFDLGMAKDGELALYKAQIKQLGAGAEVTYDFSTPEQFQAWTWDDPGKTGGAEPDPRSKQVRVKTTGSHGWTGKDRKNTPVFRLPFCFMPDNWALEATASLISDGNKKNKPDYGILVWDGGTDVACLSVKEQASEMLAQAAFSTPGKGKSAVLAVKSKERLVLRMDCQQGTLNLTVSGPKGQSVRFKEKLGFEPHYAALFVRTSDAGENATVAFENVKLLGLPDKEKLKELVDSTRAVAVAIAKKHAKGEPVNIAPWGHAASRSTWKPIAGHEPSAAIDNDPATYWDEEHDRPEYRFAVTFDQPHTVNAISISGMEQHNGAPKDFDILADGKVVKEVRNASYVDNLLRVEFPAARLGALELRITACHGKSAAMRELGIYEP